MKSQFSKFKDEESDAADSQSVQSSQGPKQSLSSADKIKNLNAKAQQVPIVTKVEIITEPIKPIETYEVANKKGPQMNEMQRIKHMLDQQKIPEKKVSKFTNAATKKFKEDKPKRKSKTSGKKFLFSSVDALISNKLTDRKSKFAQKQPSEKSSSYKSSQDNVSIKGKNASENLDNLQIQFENKNSIKMLNASSRINNTYQNFQDTELDRAAGTRIKSHQEIIVPETFHDIDSMDVDSESKIIHEEDAESSMTNSMAVFSELNDDESNVSIINKQMFLAEPIGTQAIIRAKYSIQLMKNQQNQGQLKAKTRPSHVKLSKFAEQKRKNTKRDKKNLMKIADFTDNSCDNAGSSQDEGNNAIKIQRRERIIRDDKVSNFSEEFCDVDFDEAEINPRAKYWLKNKTNSHIGLAKIPNCSEGIRKTTGFNTINQFPESQQKNNFNIFNIFQSIVNSPKNVFEAPSRPKTFFKNPKYEQIDSMTALMDHKLSAKINQKYIEDSHNYLTDITPSCTDQTQTQRDIETNENNIGENDPIYLINKQLKEQNYIDEEDLQVLTERAKSQKKQIDKQNKSLDYVPQSDLQVKNSLQSQFQTKNLKNMAKFKHGFENTESDYDSQVAKSSVSSDHVSSAEYSSELDCSSDASSESNGKQEYIEMLKQMILQEQTKEKKKKEVLAEEPIVKANYQKVDDNDIIPELIKDMSLPHFPELVQNNPDYNDQFIKQFGDIIGKKLKKKLEKVQNLDQKQIQFQKADKNTNKKTLVLALDDCILKTSIFKDEFPRIDGQFVFQKLKVYVCFRNYLKEFVHQASRHFEIILWSSSQPDYASCIQTILETGLQFKFDFCLTLADQTSSEEHDFFVKNIEILNGNRNLTDILIIDSQMSNFTNRLTNGIFLPCYRMHEDENDIMLKILLKYLGQFIYNKEPDFRTKIKSDFGLLEKFNGFKQTQAFLKIKKTLEEVMDTNNDQ